MWIENECGNESPRTHDRCTRQKDLICPECGAGFQIAHVDVVCVHFLVFSGILELL